MKRILYLSPSFYPYRVAVFDHLYETLGEGFMVVTSKHQLKPNSIIALKLGKFPRILLRGKHIPISRHHSNGLEAPFGVTITPGLAPTLAKLRPTLVISNNFNLWTLTSLLMMFPTIIFWEGTAHTERTVKPWRLAMRRWMVKRATAFVVNGALSKGYLIEELGAPEERIIEGGMCSELVPHRFAPARPRGHVRGEPVRFLYSGQLIAGKGVQHLLYAFAILKERLGPEARCELRLLGDGPEGPHLRKLARQLGIAEYVEFVGRVAADEVWQHYYDACVLVMPTLQDNWPLVVPEAMSMGLPVLLSQYTGSVPDLLLENRNGFVFDPFDHEQLAMLMAKYVGRPELISIHGAESLARVEQYTPERVANAFLKGLSLYKHKERPGL